jgi:GAF domain-containing protein
MALSLWLGCYVITRSPRSRLAWQSSLTLWSLAGIFLDSFVAINPSPATNWWPGWPLNTPLAVWYHLSLETLPQNRACRQRPILFVVYAATILLDLILGLTSWVVADSRRGIGVTIKIFTPGPLFPLLPICLTGLSLLTLYNFWQARQSAPNLALRKQLDSLVRGTALGALGVGYGMAAVVFKMAVPTLPMLLALGLGVASLGYGIVRYSALTEGRVLRYDFAFSGLLVASVAAIYLALMSAYGIPSGVQVFVLALVIVTHSGFDFARRALDQLFLRRRERALRATLHSAATEVGEREEAEEGLRSALAAVVTAVDARWGLIALREGEGFVVHASFHSRRVRECLSVDGLDVRELTILPPGTTHQHLTDLAVVAPLIAENDSIGVILLGPPKGGPAYSERDLDLVAEAADGLAELMRNVRQQEAHANEIEQMLESFQTRERQLQEEIDSLHRPAETETLDGKQVADVEDALRRLYDYSYLGDHALTASVASRTDQRPATHLDRGKALNTALIAAIEKLRPAGTEPRELPPREWHPYVVLRAAYVNGEANRDIMSRLYISEATFHRTRRRALRAVAKALFEMGASAN